MAVNRDTIQQQIEEKVQQLAQQLLARQQRIAVAESCTGGLLAAACTELAGSSAWFERGFVTYSNAAKQELLGVSAAQLATHGAVSTAVAEAMAEGALRHAHADHAVAITGIAGPGGGTPDKPVGTVCFALASEQGILSHTTHRLTGNRQAVRQQAVSIALDLLLGAARAKC